MLDSGVTFAGAWVPQGTYIAQIVAVARVHIWAPGQVLGIRAQLQGTGLCSPLPHSLPLLLWRGGGTCSTLLTRGMQAHFPRDDRSAFISRMASVGFTPCVSKCDSESCITVRNACTVCSYISRTTAIDFVDRLKCHGMCAKPMWLLTEAVSGIMPT